MTSLSAEMTLDRIGSTREWPKTSHSVIHTTIGCNTQSVWARVSAEEKAAMVASPLDWYSSPQRFLQNLLHPVIPSAPWRSPYDCSLPSLIGFDNEEMNPSLQKDSLLRWPDGAESHR